MGEVIDFAAKKKELEDKKKKKLVQQLMAKEPEQEQENEPAHKNPAFSFDEIMKANIKRREEQMGRRSKSNENVKRSYRLKKTKKEPQ